MIVGSYNARREGVIKLQPVKRELSNLFKCPVIRVQVVENHTVDYPRVPELNLANDNAYQLLHYLQDQGLPVDPNEPSGRISIDAIKFVLSDKSPPSPEPYAGDMSPATIQVMRQLQDGDSPINESKAINCSRPITQRFPGYMAKLKEMADFIDRNQLPDRNIIYG